MGNQEQTSCINTCDNITSDLTREKFRTIQQKRLNNQAIVGTPKREASKQPIKNEQKLSSLLTNNQNITPEDAETSHKLDMGTDVLFNLILDSLIKDYPVKKKEVHFNAGAVYIGEWCSD